jgi:hypothetical protein
MTIFGRQPAFWIGLIVTIALGVIQTLMGNGLISEVTAGKTVDLVNAVAQILTVLAPLIAGLLIRTQVTPLADPALPQGTTVTVVTPGDLPNKTQLLS